MSLGFDDELRSIAAAAKEKRDKLTPQQAAYAPPAVETLDDISDLFAAFPFCRDRGATLSTYREAMSVGSDRWQRTFEYDCISIRFGADGLVKTGLFAKTGPGERVLKEDEHRIRLLNVNTFGCVAVGAKESAMALARLLAEQV